MSDSKHKFIHAKGVSFNADAGFYTEYDQWGRTVFHRDSHGYWSMRFYDKPDVGADGKPIVNVRPYEVIHRWWNLYEHAKQNP